MGLGHGSIGLLQARFFLWRDGDDLLVQFDDVSNMDYGGLRCKYYYPETLA